MAERQWLASMNLPKPPKIWRARGCKACFQTGYSGRIGIFEIWRKTETDYRHLIGHADEHTLRQQLRERGGKTILQDSLRKAAEGITSLSEIQRMGALTNAHDGGHRFGKRQK